MLKRLNPTYFIAFFFILLSLIFSILPWIENLDNGLLNLYTRLRGPREVSKDILFVHMGDEDIQALSGWPVTRDYYAYFVHLLTEQNVKVIGLDLLLDTESQTYPEYDQMLASFIKTNGNVILPFVYQKREDDVSFLKPAEIFTNHVKETGFSNLGESSLLNRIPVSINYKDQRHFTFGVMLAKTALNADSLAIKEHALLFYQGGKSIREIGLDANHNMLLNHFGSPGQINSIGFVDAIKILEDHPDSLNLKNKHVILGSTATSLPVIKRTVLCSQFPATLAHVTVFENIFYQNWIKVLPWFITPLWTIILIILLLWMQFLSLTDGIRKSLLILIGYLLPGFLGFVILNIRMPALPFYLCIMAIITKLSWIFYTKKQLLSGRNRLLKAQIQKKRSELKIIQETLDKSRMDVDEKTVSLHQKEETVERLKSHINDLESSNLPVSHFRTTFEEIIHAPDSSVNELLQTVEKIGESDISVLITGETGTGKELVAKALHQQSQLKNRPFVAVNCGALPDALLESELFGHEKGSFTGALTQRRGRFETAHRGTLFLDEITETSSAFQARLLRALQEGEIERLGSEKPIQVDVRIIAASNKDVEKEVIAGHFRQDLFYRLNGFILTIPPLRERRMDIPLLVTHFIGKYTSHKMNISYEALNKLKTWHWPGNVRELENIIHRSVVLVQSEKRNLIRLSDLPETIVGPKEIQSELIPIDQQILKALRQFEFSHTSIRMTADALGNKDRGTITEYLRGMCFQKLVENNYNLDKAATSLAGSSSPKIYNRVHKKMHGYLKNLKSQSKNHDENSEPETTMPSAFSGLPKKYHEALKQVIRHINEF